MLHTIRLKRNKVFKYILKNGEFFKGKYVSIHITKINKNTDNVDRNYFGICISKKNGNSVNRNKIKRWVREIYKNMEINLKTGYNIVIVIKKYVTVYNTDYHKLYDDIENIFKGLDLYEN